MEAGVLRIFVAGTGFTGSRILRRLHALGHEMTGLNRSGCAVAAGVPMVAGDLKKNRIGYGKGFYDRFLRDLGCPSAGLVFELCIADEIPVEDFDIPLSKLITEKRVID